MTTAALARHRVTTPDFLAGATDLLGHAVTGDAAGYAIRWQGLGGGTVYVPALCDEIVRLCRDPHGPIGYWSPASPLVIRDRCCEACAWQAACLRGLYAVEAEVTDITPRGAELAALRRAVETPNLAADTARAIISAATRDGATRNLEHPGTARLLAYVARHRPRAIPLSECEAGTCDHDRAAILDGEDPFCTFPALRITCKACTGPLTLGDALIIDAPCQPLAQVAAQYDRSPR